MKFITKIVAFTITFAFSVALIGLPKADFLPFENQINNQTQRNISLLLQRDVRNGEERDENINFRSEKSSYLEATAEAVNEYVNKSESMNDADLPPDFQSAWHEHMQAWRDYAEFLNESKTIKTSSCVFNRLEENYNQEISATWIEVLRVGGEYGATLPY